MSLRDRLPADVVAAAEDRYAQTKACTVSGESGAVEALLLAVATEHRPMSGMQVASGTTCECGYWTGSEAQVPRPGGWSQLLPHMLREAAAALADHEAAALREAAGLYSHMYPSRGAGMPVAVVTVLDLEARADRIEREG